MLDSNSIGSALLAKLAEEVSNVQAPLIADSDNEEEDRLHNAVMPLCLCVLSAAMKKKKCSSRQQCLRVLSKCLVPLLRLMTMTM